MAKGLLIIRTLTPTHPGAGASVGAIDLMLQREVTTDFPFIQGSSLKGAVRSYLKNEPNSVLDNVFGPRNVESSDFRKGSLIISDASLLFYPVRTLKGLYALVTCPEILRRLNMPHVKLLPENSKKLLEWNDKEKVLPLGENVENFKIGDRVYFEDLNFGIDSNSIDTSWINELPIENEDKSRIFLVHDDVFQYFVKFATQVMSRNRISYNTGVVETGALWTEEHLPPETYLFSYLKDDEKKVGKIEVKNGEDETEKEVTAFKWLKSKIDSQVIHLGGDETVGKGFVELKVKELSGGNQNV